MSESSEGGTQQNWNWERFERLMKDLMADGYDVDDVITSTSTAEVDDKMVQVVVSRE